VALTCVTLLLKPLLTTASRAFSSVGSCLGFCGV
jgi:hypothetical protein